MFKKITLALMGIVSSGLVTAGSIGPVCAPGQVTVACAAQHWDLGVQALYLRSVYSTANGYRVSSLSPTGTTAFNEIRSDWNWGYRLEGSYHFGMGTDVTVSYIHFNANANQANLLGFIPLPVNGTIVAIPSTFAIVGQNHFDQVNAVLGQRARFGVPNSMRFYSGLQYAHIQLDSTNLYPANAGVTRATGFTTVSQYNNSEFQGVGPVVGLDYAYDIAYGLSFTANGAGSILYGKSRYSNGYVGAPVGVTFASIYGYKNAMVPSLEAKLGMNLAYNMAQGVLNFAGGYQAVNYFNAFQTQGSNGFVGPLTDSSYSLYGPYLGLNYVG